MTAPVGRTDLVSSFVRTLVPLVVGWVVSVAARHGWSINDDQAASAITALSAYAYYVLVRLLETRANSKAGWLLGVAKQPVYTERTVPNLG